VDSSGNVYVTGCSYSGTSYDYTTIKYSSSGAQQWVARYNGPANGSDIAGALAIDSSGNVYVTGQSYGSGTTGYDYATIKYNSSGAQQWVAYYNGPGNGDDSACDLAVDSSGNVYVTGQSYSSSTGVDYATIKYNSNGAQQWVARYNGPAKSSDIACALAVDSSGNVYVTGQSYSSGTTGVDYATIKYNSSGDQQWAAFYNGPGNSDDIVCGLAVDSSGNVYVTGQSYGGGTTGNDYATIKYSQYGPDTIPPTTTATPSPVPNTNGWNNTDVTVSLNATDNEGGSGVKEIHYQVDAEAEQVVSAASASVPLTGEGQHTLNYWAVDNAGNAEASESLVINIDKTKPASSGSRAPGPNANGWNSTDVTVSLNATDNEGGSGVREIRYRVDAEAEQGVSAASASVLLTKEGQHTLNYWAVDNAGKAEASKSLVINIDKTKPAISSSRSPGPNANGWNNTDVTVNFTATDNLGDPGVTGPTIFSQEGANQAVTGTAYDKAGNFASVTVGNINIDKTPPTINVATPQTRNYVTSQSFTLDFSASDALSGLSGPVATLDGKPVVSGQVINLANMAGSHNLTVSASDKASNSTTVSVDFYVAIAATIRVEPDSLSLKSQSDKTAITAYIEFPTGYSVERIDVPTVWLSVNGMIVPAQLGSASKEDSNLVVRFNREDVIIALAGQTGKVTLTVGGTLNDGRRFVGTDTINVN